MPDEPDKEKEKDKGDAAAEGATGSTAVDEVLTTEIRGSAESYRRLGEIFISLLAGLPAASLIASFVRAPGENGFHDGRLEAGIALAVLAIGFGLLLAFRLRAPVELDRKKLDDFDMSKIVGTRQETYTKLVKRIDQLSASAGSATDENKRKDYERRLANVVDTLRRVHLVATAGELRSRVNDWRTWLLVICALASAAWAVDRLALAPKLKAAEGPTVVEVTLTDSGKADLGCSSATFRALKVGGSDDAPKVVPLGDTTCTKGEFLELKVEEEKGTASKVEAAEAGSP